MGDLGTDRGSAGPKSSVGNEKKVIGEHGGLIHPLSHSFILIQ